MEEQRRKEFGQFLRKCKRAKIFIESEKIPKNKRQNTRNVILIMTVSFLFKKLFKFNV